MRSNSLRSTLSIIGLIAFICVVLSKSYIAKIDTYIVTIYIAHIIGAIVVTCIGGFSKARKIMSSIDKYPEKYEKYWEKSRHDNYYETLEPFIEINLQLIGWRFTLMLYFGYFMYLAIVPIIIYESGYGLLVALNPFYITLAPLMIVFLIDIMTYIWLRNIFINTALTEIGIGYNEFIDKYFDDRL
ncbi:MAG: hypothetical protein OEV92_09235 [Nitrospinota bacterium]|nr:hypothetical protein [Nitrospinota bacterium]